MTLGDRYRIGLIGLTPPSSWAAVAHLPALRALEDKYEIVGVANSSPESATIAARESGIERAFASVEELVSDDDVDIVVVTVKASAHFSLVEAALSAGKHVFCEWPLGNGLNETRKLADLARSTGVRTVCGAQASHSPVLQYARDLVRDGRLGTVLSTTLVADAGSWGAVMPQNIAYALDASNGATMLSVPIGHTLTGVASVLGKTCDVQALVSTRREHCTIAETGEKVALQAPDQIIVAGTLEGGIPLSLHYRGGLSAGQGFRWEILGTDGELEITGPMGPIEMVDLGIRGAFGGESERSDLTVPQEYQRDLDLEIIPGNVARLYASFYEDLRSGSRTAFSFDDAVEHHKVLDAIEESSLTGRRVTL